MKKLSALRNGMILLITMLILFAGVASARAEDGIIDSQTVFANYTDYKRALKEYNALTAQARKQINRQILSEKDEARRQTLKKQYDDYCAEQSKRLLLPLQERTKKTVAQIAKERGLERVYEVGVKPDNNGLDITNVVIFTLNSGESHYAPAAIREAVPQCTADANTRNSSIIKAKNERQKTDNKQQTKASSEQREVGQQASQQPAAKKAITNGGVRSAHVSNKEQLKSDNSQSAGSPVRQSAIIQFFAGYNRAETEAAVSRAGRIASEVRLEEGKDKSGNTLWRGYAYCASQAQAKALCSRLRRAGFGCFVVK